MPSDNLEISKIRNEYLQLLRIQVRNRYLHGIFKDYPPDTDKIAPLAEVLGNNIARQVTIVTHNETPIPSPRFRFRTSRESAR